MLLPGLLLASFAALCAALLGASRDLVVGLLLGMGAGELLCLLAARRAGWRPGRVWPPCRG